MSLYYEDFAVGRVLESRGRTVTEADIVNFAGLSGDFVELHTNEEFARKAPFGRRGYHAACQLRRGGAQDRRAGARRLRSPASALSGRRGCPVPHGKSRQEK